MYICARCKQEKEDAGGCEFLINEEDTEFICFDCLTTKEMDDLLSDDYCTITPEDGTEPLHITLDLKPVT